MRSTSIKIKIKRGQKGRRGKKNHVLSAIQTIFPSGSTLWLATSVSLSVMPVDHIKCAFVSEASSAYVIT